MNSQMFLSKKIKKLISKIWLLLNEQNEDTYLLIENKLRPGRKFMI